VKLKLDTSLDFVNTFYEIDVGDSKKGIVLTEETTTDFGTSETILDPSLVSSKVKDLKFFKGRTTATVDPSFKTNVLYSSSFAKNGNVFSATNSSVLTDSNPNFYLYSKEQNADQNVIGYSFNVSPNRGSLLHIVNQSDNKSYIFGGTNTVIGSSLSFYGTEYTGLTSSPFLLLKFDFTSQTDTFKLKINQETEVVVGDYTADTFKYLCAGLSDLLYTYGILVIPCKNNMVAFDRFDGTDTIELVLTSLYTKITTVPKFTSFEYLSSTKTVTYDPVLHPVNFTFTYVDNVDNIENYPLTYKLGIVQDTGRNTNYSSYRVRLKFDIQSARNTTQDFKLEIEEGTLEPTFTINDTDTIEAILDMIGDEINNFLPSNYSVEKGYLTSSIDIINNQATETTYIKVTTGPWMTIDPEFGGVYVENPDGSKTIIIKPNDGSLTITNDTGMLGFDAMYSQNHIFGVTSLNPVTGAFSEVNYITAIWGGQATPGGDYCYLMYELNSKFREYGYEAIPLYTSTTSGVHYYIGFTRIVSSPSQTKLAIGVNNKQHAYDNHFYISGKDLYRTNSQDGVRVKNTKGNASIEAWKDKVVPVPPNSTYQARAFEIADSTVSLYKSELSGFIANRDGIIVNYMGATYFTYKSSRVLNPITNPLQTCIDLVDILSAVENGWTPETSVNGTVYKATRNGVATVTLDTSTMAFTLSLVKSVRRSYCNSIGFEQEGDITITNYAGWVKYPYGYNNNHSGYGKLEVSPHIYMLISAYHPSIDGV
jgi:hypothetical protein